MLIVDKTGKDKDAEEDIPRGTALTRVLPSPYQTKFSSRRPKDAIQAKKTFQENGEQFQYPKAGPRFTASSPRFKASQLEKFPDAESQSGAYNEREIYTFINPRQNHKN